MSFLEAWVGTPPAAAVGWTLLHSLWQGALIAATLAAVLWAVRPARVRYVAASAAMLFMLAAFAVTFARMMPHDADGLRAATGAAFPAWNVRMIDGSGPSAGMAAVAPWLTPFWIVGVWLFYLSQLAGWISIRRLRRRGVCCPSGHWQEELARLGRRLRVSRPVQLLDSCLAETPMVLGHFRPVIVLPLGLLAGLPLGQIEAILLHELAHVRRCDYLVNALQRLVEGLFFYHPAVWWISHVIRAERENCCDDVVVATSGNAREYVEALAALEQNRRAGGEPAVAATGGSLVKRIRRLLYPKTRTGSWTPLLAAAVLLVTAALVLPAWQSQPPQKVPPYQKWLNQDVVYIIDDAERAAFLKLATDPEREMFIEQFWRRRDPTPGTPENEFKEEHYRRIAYANQKYRTASGRRAGKPTAATCTSFTARQTRSRSTPKGRRRLTRRKSGGTTALPESGKT